MQNKGLNSLRKYEDLKRDLMNMKKSQPDRSSLIDLSITLIETIQEQDQMIEDLQNSLQELVQLLDNPNR